MASEQIDELLTRVESIDRLAAFEHERWAHWQQYVHDQCRLQPDGSLVIPANLVERWQRQISTAYTNLSPSEQESDREQVYKYLPVVIEILRHGSRR